VFNRLAWAALVITSISQSAQAQQLDAQLFHPNLTLEGLTVVKSGDTTPLWKPTIGVTLGYARDPVLLMAADGSRTRALVDHRYDGLVYASIGLLEIAGWGFDLGAAMPLTAEHTPVLWTEAGIIEDPQWAYGRGDARLEGRLTLLPREVAYVDLAVGGSVTFPTAAGGPLLGNPDPVYTPEVYLSTEVGPVLVAVNAGYRLQEERVVRSITIAEELLVGGGVGFDLEVLGAAQDSQVSLEVFGTTPADDPFAEATRAQSPLEGMLSVRLRGGDFVWTAAGGIGLTEGIGSPKARAVLSAAFAPRFVDSDHDLVADEDDRCVDVPEDADAFEDGDGCPEADNDKDGLLDDADACPDVPEDKDEFKDDDGCPDDDNDEDRVLDVADKCPSAAEDVDGFEDADGCPDKDNDADNVPDERDRCPNDREDIDGFQDADGCAENDNDADGFTDDKDACPNQAEDLNGNKDDDGCPDAADDGDGDGIKDLEDKCKKDAEDKDSFEDADGCPEPDNDGDKVLDGGDGCPDLAEDKDKFEDEDGCPDYDNDLDGIRDDADKCPNEAEVINGIDDGDGCPDKGAELVKLTADKIQINDKVYFESGSDVLLPRSFPLLNQIAALMKNHAGLRIRVEGHTDDVGGDDFNHDLSQKRAESVRAYVGGQGVEAKRLEAVGYGESRPIASNKSSAGREINRRVEFIVLEPEQAAAPTPTPAPAPSDTKPVEAAADAAAPAPAPVRDDIFYTYTLKKAASLKDLSRSLWKTSSHAELLLTHNPAAEKIDKKLDVGVTVKIPRTTTYTVKRGDTLGDIAKKTIGNSKLHPLIAEASKGVLPDVTKLDVGMVLTVPLVNPESEKILSK
jgi:outer membrane protein OmpA-like peptidoglycan-associated protein